MGRAEECAPEITNQRSIHHYLYHRPEHINSTNLKTNALNTRIPLHVDMESQHHMTVAITNYFYSLPSLFIALFDPFFEFLLPESNNRDILNKRPPLLCS